jgi:hypothetical protein
MLVIHVNLKYVRTRKMKGEQAWPPGDDDFNVVEAILILASLP